MTKRKIIDYKVIHEKTIINLQLAVNDFLKDGYKTTGGVSSFPFNDDGYPYCFLQAIVKDEEV